MWSLFANDQAIIVLSVILRRVAIHRKQTCRISKSELLNSGGGLSFISVIWVVTAPMIRTTSIGVDIL
jgi:hypothetical protein